MTTENPDGRELRFDLVVVGGGPGGYVCAIRAAQYGLKVALVEKDRLGGLCLNRGCIPTKSMVRSAETWALTRKAAAFGVHFERAALDFQQVMQRKRDVVDGLVKGVEQLIRSNGVTLIPGTAWPRPGGSVEVVGAAGEPPVVLQAPHLVLATGSESVRLPIPGADLPGVMDSDSLLAMDRVPASLAVIGGGIIGSEFASIFHAFGSRVFVLELLPSLLPMADAEISRRLGQSFRRAGIGVRTGVRVEAIEPAGEPQGPAGPLKRVRFTSPEGQAGSVEAEVVLVAVGRRPSFSHFRPDEMGIETVRGGVKVDGYMQTTRPGTYAVGDLNGLSLLAHAASAQGLIAAARAAGRSVRPWGSSPVPSAVFTLPEVAWVGLTEEQARESGIGVSVGRFLYGALGRAQVDVEPEGMVKILARAESPDRGEIIGVHVMGRGATELVHEGVLAMTFGATAEELAEAIHAHPTFSEAVGEAAWALAGYPIHMVRR